MVEKQLAKRSSSALFNFFLPSCEIVISGWKNFLAFLAWRPWHCRFFSTKKLFARIFYTLLLLFLCWSAPVFIVSFIHSFLLTCNCLSIKRHSVILGGKIQIPIPGHTDNWVYALLSNGKPWDWHFHVF